MVWLAHIVVPPTSGTSMQRRIEPIAGLFVKDRSECQWRAALRVSEGLLSESRLLSRNISGYPGNR